MKHSCMKVTESKAMNNSKDETQSLLYIKRNWNFLLIFNNPVISNISSMYYSMLSLKLKTISKRM